MSKLLSRLIPFVDKHHLIEVLLSKSARLEQRVKDIEKALSQEKEENQRLATENKELISEQEKLEDKITDLQQDLAYSREHCRRFVVRMLVEEGNELEKTVKQLKEERLREELLLKQQFELEKFAWSAEKERLEKEVAQRNQEWSSKCDWLREELLKTRSERDMEVHMERVARKQDQLAFEKERKKLKEEMHREMEMEKQYSESQYNRIVDSIQQTLGVMMAFVGYRVVEYHRDGASSCQTDALLSDMLEMFYTHKEKMEREVERTEWYKKNLEDLQGWVERNDSLRTMSESDSSGLPPSPLSPKFMIAMPSCQICLQEYSSNPDKTPRNLDCGHSICEECAITMSKESDERFIRCPFDRHQTQLPSRTVLDLPKNFPIMQMFSDNAS